MPRLHGLIDKLRFVRFLQRLSELWGFSVLYPPPSGFSTFPPLTFAPSNISETEKPVRLLFSLTRLPPSLEPVLVVPPAWDSPTTWLVVFTHQPPSHDGCAAFKSTGNPMKASALPSPLYPPCWLVLSCCCWQPASWYQNNQTSPSSTAGPGPRPSKAPPRVLWPGSVLQSTVSVCSPYLIFFFPLQQDDERLI